MGSQSALASMAVLSNFSIYALNIFTASMASAYKRTPFSKNAFISGFILIFASLGSIAKISTQRAAVASWFRPDLDRSGLRRCKIRVSTAQQKDQAQARQKIGS